MYSFRRYNEESYGIADTPLITLAFPAIMFLHVVEFRFTLEIGYGIMFLVAIFRLSYLVCKENISHVKLIIVMIISFMMFGWGLSGTILLLLDRRDRLLLVLFEVGSILALQRIL